MTAFLLDTNVLSEAYRPRPHPGVVAWMTALPEGSAFISVITIGEIHRGIVGLRGRDKERAAHLDIWLADIEDLRRDSILPVDVRTSKRWAELRLNHPRRDPEDLLIAATAAAHGLTVATRNVRDFQNLGIPLFNPFEPAGPPP
ncbi:PIN domain-containing protein [Azospirillum sp. sgz301742]